MTAMNYLPERGDDPYPPTKEDSVAGHGAFLLGGGVPPPPGSSDVYQSI